MDAALLLFDGKCGFCTRSVLWLLERTRRPLRAVPYQLAGDVGVPREALRRAVYLLEGSRQWRGHRAVGAALRLCGQPWRTLGQLLALPGPFAWVFAAGYALVARYRRHLPGTRPACKRDWDLEAGRPSAQSHWM